MTKVRLLAMINEQQVKCNETMESLVGRRGAVEDSVRMFIPIFQDQLEIMKGLAELLP